MRCPICRWLPVAAVLLAASHCPIAWAQQVGPPAGAQQPAQATIDAGLRLFEAKQYEQATAVLSEAIQQGAGSAAAFYYRGEALRKTWWLGRATADFDRAIQMDPTHAPSHFARGLADEFVGYSDKAIADYTEAIRLDRKAALPYIRRGGLYRKRGDHDRAKADLDYGIALCDQKIALAPSDAALYRARALAYHTREQYDRAVADLTEMIRLDPRDVEGYIERGRTWAGKKDAQASLGDFDAAIRLCDEAIQSDRRELRQAYRHRALVYNARAFAWKEKEDFKKAIADFKLVSDLTPDSPVVWFYLGQAQAGAEHYGGEPGRHFDGALSAFSRAIQLDGRFAAAWQERGLLRTRRALVDHDAKQAEAAVADLSEVLRLAPGATEAYCARGGAHAVARQLPEALADFNVAIRLCPTLAEAYELRGRLRMAQGQTDEAQADLARAEELHAKRNQSDHVRLKEL